MVKRYMKRCPIPVTEMQIKTTMRCYFTLVRKLLSRKLEIASVGKDTEKREHLCTVGGNVNWCSYYGKQYGGSSKN